MGEWGRKIQWCGVVQAQIRLPVEMKAAINTTRGDGVSIAWWVREAAEVYLDRQHGWELPLAPLPRGEDYERLWVRLPGDLVERLKKQAEGQRLGRESHTLAGYLRRIIAWRLASERDTGLILRNGGN